MVFPYQIGHDSKAHSFLGEVLILVARGMIGDQAMKGFILGIAASLTVWVISICIQPYLPQFPLSKFLIWLQSIKIQINKSSTNQSCKLAAEGYGDGITVLILFVIIFF